MQHQHMGRLGALSSAYWDAVASGDTPVGVTGAYANEIDAIVPGAADQAAQTKGPWETGVDALFRVANQLATTSAQRQMLQLQLERAKQGQPPVPVAPRGSMFDFTDPKILALGALLIGGAYYVYKRRQR